MSKDGDGLLLLKTMDLGSEAERTSRYQRLVSLEEAINPYP